jgi:hypothetical protein
MTDKKMTDKKMTDTMSDEDDVVNFAKALNDRELGLCIIETMLHKLNIGKIGYVKVVSIMMVEYERRGLAAPEVMVYK